MKGEDFWDWKEENTRSHGIYLNKTKERNMLVFLFQNMRRNIYVSFPSFLEGLQKSFCELLLLHTEKNEWPNLWLELRSDVTAR